MTENPIRFMRDEMGLTQQALADKLGASKRQLQFQERSAEPRQLWVMAVRYLYNEHRRDQRAGIVAEAA